MMMSVLSLERMKFEDLRDHNILPGLGEEQLQMLKSYARLYSEVNHLRNEAKQTKLESLRAEILRGSKPMAWMVFSIFRRLLREGDVAEPGTMAAMRALLELLIGFSKQCRYFREEAEALKSEIPLTTPLALIPVWYQTRFLDCIPPGRRRDECGE